MTTANSLTHPHQIRLKELTQLRRSGLVVAEGEGSYFQKFIVLATIVFSFFALFKLNTHDASFYIMLPVVLIAIDFLSGFIHWFFDTQVKPSKTFLGKIAVDFLDHHIRPTRTRDVGFYVSAYRPAAYIALPWLTACLLAVKFGLLHNPVLTGAVFWAGFFSLYIPQTHKLSHVTKPNIAVKFLQEARLIMHPRAHALHHKDDRKAYCVFTGWLNPLLDGIKFWRGLEWMFDRVRSVLS